MKVAINRTGGWDERVINAFYDLEDELTLNMYDEEFRVHPKVIQYIEENPSKQWKVVEIPFDSIEGWSIHASEEFGVEWVAEVHRIWF